jgi:hypothetical protein
VTSPARRPLNIDEFKILRLIKEVWGPQNKEAGVFFSVKDDACMFVEATNGSLPVVVNLTNLGAWYRDGSYSHEDVLSALQANATKDDK